MHAYYAQSQPSYAILPSCMFDCRQGQPVDVPHLLQQHTCNLHRARVQGQASLSNPLSRGMQPLKCQSSELVLGACKHTPAVFGDETPLGKPSLLQRPVRLSNFHNVVATCHVMSVTTSEWCVVHGTAVVNGVQAAQFTTPCCGGQHSMKSLYTIEIKLIGPDLAHITVSMVGLYHPIAGSTQQCPAKCQHARLVTPKPPLLLAAATPCAESCCANCEEHVGSLPHASATNRIDKRSPGHQVIIRCAAATLEQNEVLERCRAHCTDSRCIFNTKGCCWKTQALSQRLPTHTVPAHRLWMHRHHQTLPSPDGVKLNTSNCLAKPPHCRPDARMALL